MSWFYHVLMIYVFACQLFLNYLYIFMFLGFYSKFWFGTNLVLIKLVAICVLSCSLILHDTAWQCLHSRNQSWKEVVAREKNRWLILRALLLNQRRLEHWQDSMMSTSSNHMLHLKLMTTTSGMLPCWWKGWLSRVLFLIRTFKNGLLTGIETSS